MKKVLYHIKWFYYFTSYSGIAVRKSLLKKGTDDPEVLEISNLFWLAFVNGFTIITYLLPLLLTKEEFLSLPKSTTNLYVAIPYLIKTSFDYYVFFWNKDFLKITYQFENNISKLTKVIYTIIFVSLAIITLALFVRNLVSPTW